MLAILNVILLIYIWQYISTNLFVRSDTKYFFHTFLFRKRTGGIKLDGDEVEAKVEEDQYNKELSEQIKKVFDLILLIC